MDLANLVSEHGLDLERLAKDLDELGQPGRLWAIAQWGKPIQARLFEAAKGFRPIGLDDFVPSTVPPLTEVVHRGKNTLPYFTRFEKRFCKPADTAAETGLWGYNHQPLSAVTGPGYFVAHPGTEPGEVEIDYTLVPTEKPDSWPPVVPSAARLGRFVYAGVVDVLRGIASGVTIGRARRKSGFIDAWFVLVRDQGSA